MVTLHPHERLDDLHRNGLKIIQNPKLFCFGVDAVLLTGFVKVKKGELLLDLGTGTGIIPILLSAKTEAAHFTGLEIQEASVDLARRSVAFNGLTDRITIDQGDICQTEGLYKPSHFHVITCNPPYMNAGGGLTNPDSPMAIARHELCCTLQDVIDCAARLLKPAGRFYMIHRPHRLTDIITQLRERGLEPKTMRFIHPFAHKEPTMVMVEAIRGGKPMVKVLPPLVIYQSQGQYTQEAYDIYYG